MLIKNILKYLNDHRGKMEYFLRWLVLAESPSSVPESQKKILTLLSEALQRINCKTQDIPGWGKSGGHLFATPANRKKNRPYQLLLGHCDTVWPVGTLKEMPQEIEDGKMKGPGVYDMKAGLAQIIYALKTIDALNLDPEVTPVVFINSDEETGSKESTRYIKMLASNANRAFVLEPSLGPTGKLKTTRKGANRYTITIKGKAAHAGLDPEGGASAILELSHVIQKLFALNDPEKGITVNVGMIDGGLRPNVIAPKSKALVDARILTQVDAEAINIKISNLKPQTPGTKIIVESGMGRPPLENNPRNRAVWELAKNIGKDLDMELEEGVAGGASDGNTTSLFTATLDGLGAVGAGAHAEHEHIILDKLIERTALLILLILAPPLPKS